MEALMRSRGLIVILFSVALGYGIGTAWAQSSGVDLTSGIERRDSSSQRRDQRTSATALTEPTVTNFGRVIPSAQITDSAAAYGLGGHYVRDTTHTTDGQFFTTLRAGYKAGVPRNGGSHTDGYSFGADVQLNHNADTFGQFTLSGDIGGVVGRAKNAGPTLEWDYAPTEKSGTFIATASYLTLFPKGADRVSDLVPGLAYEYTIALKIPLKIIGEYTFTNDLDEEDDFAISARIKLGHSSLRFGAGKGPRAFVSLTQTFAPKK